MEMANVFRDLVADEGQGGVRVGFSELMGRVD